LSYSARCMAKPGHYFDRLVKKCVRCAEVCGKHPPSALEFRFELSPGFLARKSQRRESENCSPANLCDEKIRSRSLDVPPAGQEGAPRVGAVNQRPVSSLLLSLFFTLPLLRFPDPTCLSYLACREPSDDSIPIETCACVRCFPDLRVLGQDNDTLKKITLWIYVILLCTSVPHDYNEFNQ
uniref:TACI cysteine-rich domain-containing protein n=1 Tax=Nothobranchius furzeri TaxID=105023 RepID=A0A8C6ME81_NOTFU